MPLSDSQAVAYGKNQEQERSDLLFALENKQANRSWQMALFTMLVGGNVLHRCSRGAGALLRMKRRATIALGLPHDKQIKQASVFW